MRYGLRVLTPPVYRPISLQEAKDHLRVDSDDDDALIEGMIAAATNYFDGPAGILNRAILAQTLELTLPEFPCGPIVLPCPDLIEIVSLRYATLGSPDRETLTEYQIDRAGVQARLWPAYGQSWPSVPCGLVNAVTIAYRAGFGTHPGAVPDDLKSTVKLMLSDLYENREPVITGAIVSKLDTLQALWFRYKVGLE